MDPITQQLSKAALERATPTPASGGSSASSFQSVLDFQSTQTDNSSVSNLIEFVDNTFSTKAGAPTAIDASSVHVELAKATEVQKTPGANHLFDLLKGFNQDQLQFENLKELVTSGRSFKPQELLSMQVGVQHMTLQLEMVTKFSEGLVRVPNTIINMNFS